MEKFKSYYFTTDPKDIPPKVREQIDKLAHIDFEHDSMLASCGINQWGSRGKYWVVVTGERIIAYKYPILHQNFFRDLTGVERSFAHDVVLLSPGNKSDLFPYMMRPPQKLSDRMFQIVQARWLVVRQSPHDSPSHEVSDAVERLERLAKLREAGHLSENEFQTQKTKILET